MKPRITFETLKMTPKSLYHVFAHIATSEDFKKVFLAQAKGGLGSLQNIVADHCRGIPTLVKRMEDFANADENYSTLVRTMVTNLTHFENVIIPTRSCDFFVEETGKQETYFWVEERIELTVDIPRQKFHIAKLMVDPKSDSLLFNNGEDGWVEYMGIEGTFSGRCKAAYDNFLADAQILKD